MKAFRPHTTVCNSFIKVCTYCAFSLSLTPSQSGLLRSPYHRLQDAEPTPAASSQPPPRIHANRGVRDVRWGQRKRYPDGQCREDRAHCPVMIVNEGSRLEGVDFVSSYQPTPTTVASPHEGISARLVAWWCMWQGAAFFAFSGHLISLFHLCFLWYLVRKR